MQLFKISSLALDGVQRQTPRHSFRSPLPTTARSVEGRSSNKRFAHNVLSFI
jgi:hypothetical protein